MCMHAHVRAVDGTRKKPLVVSRLLARAEPLLARVRLLLAPFVPDDVRLLPISFAPMDRGRQKTRNEALAEDLLKEVNQLRQRSASCIHACTRAHARARARARTHTHTHTHKTGQNVKRRWRLRQRMRSLRAPSVWTSCWYMSNILLCMYVLNSSAATRTDVRVARSALQIDLCKIYQDTRLVSEPYRVSAFDCIHAYRTRKASSKRACRTGNFGRISSSMPR